MRRTHIGGHLQVHAPWRAACVEQPRVLLADRRGLECSHTALLGALGRARGEGCIAPGRGPPEIIDPDVDFGGVPDGFYPVPGPGGRRYNPV